MTIILLDGLNTPYTEMGNARAEIVKFLQQLQPQDRVALYGLSNQLYVLHDFTSDVSSLLDALKKSKNSSAHEKSASEVDPSTMGGTSMGSIDLDGFIESANQHAADMRTLNRAEVTANVLATIANSVMDIPGRKNLVWVSEGFPFQIGTGTSTDDPVPSVGMSAPTVNDSVQYRTFQKEIEAAAEEVNDANLAIYPVDARGLMTSPNNSASVHNPLPTTQKSRRPVAPTQATPPRENFDTLDELANRTGGRAFYNANDIQGSVRRAVDDARDSYELDYYPADVDWDGTFHEIKVEVNEPGAEVRYRRGYFALPDPAADAARVKQKLQFAMASPFEDTELGVSAEPLPRADDSMAQAQLRLRIGPDHLRFHQEGAEWVDDIQIVWIEYAAKGKPPGGFSQMVNVRLTPEMYESSMRDGVVLLRAVPIQAGAVKLRLVLRDAGSGAVGSVDMPVDKVLAPKTAAAPHE